MENVPVLPEELEGRLLTPEALVPVIVQEATTHEGLMLAWMNEESLNRTLETKRATYWSRSRNSIWVKGETSGHFQDVLSLSFDCDSDSILLLVNQTGAACHTGERSCFHSEIPIP